MFGDLEEGAFAESEQSEGRQRHDGDGGSEPVEDRVLRPRVTPAEQPDRGAVALHDGVPARDDVPHPDGHALGLDHLAGVGGGDGAASGELLDFGAGKAGEELQ